MTTKIIEVGPETFETTCPTCGTRFSYELQDVLPVARTVTCPHCGSSCVHARQVAPSERAQVP